ncbi:MAG: hypothetical protein PUK21_01195 [Peptostreptococcaceae bacterium]|nr:hypothetical protein [Peptostreptococcaceae bacterium]MDY5739624.1 hypothetical protein [Anaerovoracaceae bacterium]
MNVFGLIGKFIIDHQNTIQWIAVCAGILLMIYIVYRLIKFAIKSNRRMDKITDTLDEINANISDMTRQGDVIYIDNGKHSADTKSQADKAVDEDSIPSRKEYYSQEEIVEKLKAASDKREQVRDMEDKFNKFLSRDEGTDKHGKTYTIEEIEAIIRD